MLYTPTIYVWFYGVLFVPILVAFAYGTSARTWEASSGVFVIVATLLILGGLDHSTKRMATETTHCRRFRCSSSQRAAKVWLADAFALGAIGTGFYVLAPSTHYDAAIGTGSALCDLVSCSLQLHNHLTIYAPPSIAVAHLYNDGDTRSIAAVL